MLMSALLLTIFPLAMILAAASDLFTMTIPNRLSLALAGAFLALAPFTGIGWEAIGLHAATGAGALVLGIALFSFGWIGGGDAKLFAATALWLGHGVLLDYMLVAALLGGGLTLLILFARNMPLPAFAMTQPWVARLHDRRTGIPYGIALATAGLIAYPLSPMMIAGI
jgi:prepilin peptidase CpaA